MPMHICYFNSVPVIIVLKTLINRLAKLFLFQNHSRLECLRTNFGSAKTKCMRKLSCTAEYMTDKETEINQS